jgi:hypothetical protein
LGFWNTTAAQDPCICPFPTNYTPTQVTQTYFAGNLDALVGYPPTQAPSGCGSGDARTFVGSNLSTKLYILSAANLTCQQAYSLLLAVGSSSVLQVDGGCSEGLATIVAGANLNGACRTVPDVLAVYLA